MEAFRGQFFCLRDEYQRHPIILGCHWEKCEGCQTEITYCNATWLPSQDRLQEIIGGWRKTLIDFMWWYQNADISKINSMEQLWLAFVMKEKFGKVWNGEKWETE
jgi:hypothetical protein